MNGHDTIMAMYKFHVVLVIPTKNQLCEPTVFWDEFIP